jgi:tRNA A37 methylthiotransferase MiaB
MPGQVPVQVARERNKVLRDLAAAKNLAFRRRFLGRSLSALTLQVGRDDHTEALSDNFLKIRLAGRYPPNTWVQAEVLEIAEEDMVAEAAETRDTVPVSKLPCAGLAVNRRWTERSKRQGYNHGS